MAIVCGTSASPDRLRERRGSLRVDRLGVWGVGVLAPQFWKTDILAFGAADSNGVSLYRGGAQRPISDRENKMAPNRDRRNGCRRMGGVRSKELWHHNLLPLHRATVGARTAIWVAPPPK
jgi:hypothetical protein